MIRKIAIASVCFLTLGFCHALVAHGEMIDRIAAVVNDDIILMSELDEALMALGASLDKQGYTMLQLNRVLLEKRPEVLERLIDDKLTDQQVARQNIQVDDAEVDVTIQRIMSANRMTEDELRRALQLAGASLEDYRQQIRNRMLRTRVLSREVQSKIVITDTDVKTYYDSHQDLYAGFIKYDLRHLLMRFSPGADQSEKMKVQQQIHDLHRRLQAGESFADLAELYSQAGSASNGGALGVFGAKSLTEQVRNALKGLAEKEFTQVLETGQGYQIFYVEKIVNSGGKSLEDATPEIQEKLYADVVDEKFRSWLEELRRRSHIEIMP